MLGDRVRGLIAAGDDHQRHVRKRRDGSDEGGGLFQRAKVPTANLLEQKIRDQKDGEIFDTVTNGKGLMPAYRYPIPARDRWAIIAYVRNLEKASAATEASTV